MKLSEEIKILIDQIPPRYEDPLSHSRWMLMGGKDNTKPDYLPIIVKAFDRNRPDECKNM